jgi:hypothetical protein
VILGITGHQVLPAQAKSYAIDNLRLIMETATGPLVGVSSLAAGADQLFADVVLELGGTLKAILPCKGYEATFEKAEDRGHFERLLAHAGTAEVLPHESASEDAFFDAGRRVVDAVDLLVAIWDGAPARGRGGTADVVQYAVDRGRPTMILWPKNVPR